MNPMIKRNEILFLFDVDGTLSESRQQAPEQIIRMLKSLKERVFIAFVGGSDLNKQKEQIGDNLLEIFDYGFPENGVQYFKDGKLVSSSCIIEYLGDATYKRLVNKLFQLLSKIDCPKKRGNFIELRKSMINVSPVGRSCTKAERDEFFKWDNEHKSREMICNEINKEFKDDKIRCSIGGQISIDIFPEGWDKTYCLNHISQEKIFFFGDMTDQGGNDFEIYNHPMVQGTKVNGYEDTMKKVNERLKALGIPEIE